VLADAGMARDTVRIIQQARKDAGFDVSDRISLTVTGDASVIRAIRTHEELVGAETLSVEITLIESETLNAGLAVGENQQVEVAVAKR